MLLYTRSATDPPLHKSVYGVASVLTGLFGMNLVVFWLYAFENGDRAGKGLQVLPAGLFLLVMVVFLWPFGGWHHRGRWRFIR